MPRRYLRRKYGVWDEAAWQASRRASKPTPAPARPPPPSPSPSPSPRTSSAMQPPVMTSHGRSIPVDVGDPRLSSYLTKTKDELRATHQTQDFTTLCHSRCQRHYAAMGPEYAECARNCSSPQTAASYFSRRGSAAPAAAPRMVEPQFYTRRELPPPPLPERPKARRGASKQPPTLQDMLLLARSGLKKSPRMEPRGMLSEMPISPKLLQSVRLRHVGEQPARSSRSITPEMLLQGLRGLRPSPPAERSRQSRRMEISPELFASQAREELQRRRARSPTFTEPREEYLARNWMKKGKTGQAKGINWDASSLLRREAGVYDRPQDIAAMTSERTKKRSRQESFEKILGAIPRLYAGWGVRKRRRYY